MSKFKLTIKVNAPVGGRGGTVTKLIKKLLEKESYFEVTELNEEYNLLKITYEEEPKNIKRHQ